MSADHGRVAKELERANEEFKEFERKDIKYREDLKHVKAKLKKLQEKLAKDSAKMQVKPLLLHLWGPAASALAPAAMPTGSLLLLHKALCPAILVTW